MHASLRITGVLICAGQVQADWKRVSSSAHAFPPTQFCGFAYMFFNSLGCFGTPALPGAEVWCTTVGVLGKRCWLLVHW